MCVWFGMSVSNTRYTQSLSRCPGEISHLKSMRGGYQESKTHPLTFDAQTRLLYEFNNKHMRNIQSVREVTRLELVTNCCHYILLITVDWIAIASKPSFG